MHTCLTLLIIATLPLWALSDDIKQQIADHTINDQKEFALVVPTYNNSSVCLRNIEAILAQDYDNYHVYIVNDNSTDNTYAKLENYLVHHPLRDKVTLITNEERIGAAANYYKIISQLPDHVIVLNVDGDDFLAHSNVLKILNEVYENHNIWLTYGQFREYPSGRIGFCKPIAHKDILDHNYRHSEWLATHLRTFYAWLFKKINIEDLQYNGTIVRACCDRAIMYPLLEMCAGHFKCIEEVLIIYNCSNPESIIRSNVKVQQAMHRYVRSLKPYAPLDGIILDVD